MAVAATADYTGLTLEWDQTAGAGVAASSWTDITTYLRSGTITLGRQRELDRFQAATASFVLDNRDRRFDPLYAAGPYFGNLKPMRQLRFRNNWSAVDYDTGYFYIDGWPQSYPGMGLDTEVTLTCTDGFVWLGRAKLPPSVWAIEVAALSPARWYPLGESSGTIMGDISANAVTGVYESGATFNHRTSVLPYGGGGSIEFDGVDMNGTAPYLDSTNSTVAFWAKMPDEILVDQLTFTCIVRQDPGDNGIGGVNPRRWGFHLNPGSAGFPTEEPGHLVYTNANAGANPRYSDRQMIANRVYFIGATYDGTTAVLYVNGVAQVEDGFNTVAFFAISKNALVIGGVAGQNGPIIERSFDGVLGEVPMWDSVLTPANFADLYASGAAPWDGDTPGGRVTHLLDAVGWPASLRDIDTGTMVLGPVTLSDNPLTDMQLVEATESGLLYMSGTGAVTFVSREAMLTEARFTTSQGTFGDSTGEVPYSGIVTTGYDHLSIINGARVGRAGGELQEYFDAASVADYGPIYADDEPGLLMATDGEALDRAVWRVFQGKDPHFRVDSITVNPLASPATAWPQVLGRKVGDRITIKRRPLNVGTVISQDCHIEGITHTFAPREWLTTYSVSAVDPNETLWFIIGTGVFDTNLIG